MAKIKKTKTKMNVINSRIKGAYIAIYYIARKLHMYFTRFNELEIGDNTFLNEMPDGRTPESFHPSGI